MSFGSRYLWRPSERLQTDEEDVVLDRGDLVHKNTEDAKEAGRRHGPLDGYIASSPLVAIIGSAVLGVLAGWLLKRR